ncbi:uncharacterized protein V1516DRAFT_697408 [Lipomyces oligophaga]|uniref:uncharacterized protein n=1 Tax=Lipomyces oligophaga TaxID=45792 RepID=UPI0034CD156B
MTDIDYNYDLDDFADESDSTKYKSENAGQNAVGAVTTSTAVAGNDGSKWQVLVAHTQPDSRPVDRDATVALQISNMDWWTTEEDVRGWAAQAGVEYELKEVTFNEHKANGKSRGNVYLEFLSRQAATATRVFIVNTTKYDAVFHQPSNPYKMVPKDNFRLNRGNDMMNQNNGMGGGGMRGGGMNNRGGRGSYGGRGGYNNRGGGMIGGPGNPGGMMMQNMPMFNGMPMNMMNFHAGRGGMNMGRGGMGGGRGSRGGMDGGFNMMQMGGFGPHSFPQAHFNPAFFPGGPGGPGDGQGGGWQNNNDGNPHGSKRQRGSE